MTALDPILEGSSRTYVATIVDPDGDPVPASQILSLTLTVFVSEDCGDAPQIVNSRDAQDVLNANDVTVSDGEWRWNIREADAVVLNQRRAFETHIARLTWVHDDGIVTRTGHHVFALVIQNIRRLG